MSWTNETKTSTATLTNETKTSQSITDFLLKEDGGYLLLENGGKIILTQTTSYPVWSNQTKN